MNHVSRRLFSSVLAALAGLIFLIFAEQLGLFEGMNTYIYDTAFRIRGSIPSSDRIVIVSIDEKTLGSLGKWPLRRRYYADLLDRLTQARVVSFDLIMAEPSDDDVLLAQAIQRQGKVILPVYISDEMQSIYSLASLHPYGAGHVHVERGVDTVAREVFHTLYFNSIPLPSLSSVLYELSTNSPLPREKMPLKASEGTTPGPIFQRDLMKINYYGPPGTFRQVALVDVIENNYHAGFFNDKIVLVGVTAQGIVDKLSTPFSQHRNEMAGVEVHANILSNLLDHSFMKNVSGLARWPALVICSLLFFWLFMRFSEKISALIWLLGLTVTTAVVLYLFSAFNYWLGPALFYFAFTYLFALTYILKLDSAAKELDSEYASVVALLASGGEDAEHGADKGILGFLSSGGIDAKIQGLLHIEQRYERRLEETVRTRTSELADALLMISNMSNEMILRLTKAVESRDEGTGGHISRVGLYSKAIAEAMGMSEEFVDSITFASAMHDIGKIGIPDRILHKTGGLSPEEKKLMESHTVIGAQILSNSSYPKIQMSASIALNHHEHWNGTGYPNKLRGTEIPIEARIVTVSDHYDALRNRREYKTALDHETAFTIITEGDERTLPEFFDPDVLRAFVRVAHSFEEIFQEYQE